MYCRLVYCPAPRKFCSQGYAWLAGGAPRLYFRILNFRILRQQSSTRPPPGNEVPLAFRLYLVGCGYPHNRQVEGSVRTAAFAFILAAAFTFLSRSVLAQIPTLSPELREQLAEREQYEIVDTKAALPPALVAAMADLFRQARLQMADPGQPMQTSQSEDPNLPARRLRFGGLSSEYALVAYEKYAAIPNRTVDVVLVYELSGRAPQLIGGGITREAIPDLDRLRTALRAGQIRPLAKGYLP